MHGRQQGHIERVHDESDESMDEPMWEGESKTTGQVLLAGDLALVGIHSHGSGPSGGVVQLR